jgi:hypothetical protein
MFKQYILGLIISFGFVSSVAQADGSKDVLAGLDSFGENPVEALKKDINKRFLPVVERLLTVEHLEKCLTDEDKEILKMYLAGEKKLKELMDNQEVLIREEPIFMKLNQEFEKKGMTQENSMAFVKAAQEKCPIFFQYVMIRMELEPMREILGTLLVNVFLKSLHEMSDQAVVKQ